MIHKFYYRLIVLLTMGCCMYLLPNTSQAQTDNRGWECAECNDNNPCTYDLCYGGACYNIPTLGNCNGNNGQQRGCNLQIIQVKATNCYYDTRDRKDKVQLEVCVWWKGADPSKDLKVFINGQNKTIDIKNAAGDDCVTFVVDANGTQNNKVWAEFVGNTECRDEKKYNLPAACTPACDVDITKALVGDCYYDHATGESKAELTVCVDWSNRPGSEDIVVSIKDQYKVIQPGGGSGNKCVKFVIPADGTYGNGIWAKFQYTYSCQDEAKYDAPKHCYEAPACDLDITSVSVSECYYDHSDYKSKAELLICVSWKNRPTSENIVVSIAGQQQIIYPTSSTGSKCVKFIVLANGTSYNGIWAKFQYSTACQDEDKYHSPYPCYQAPQCDLQIKSATVGACYFDHTTYKSKAELTICVEWKNRPSYENIVVSIAGQYQIIYTGASSGYKCVKFVVDANGTQNNGIWAKFQYTSSCQDEYFYHCPQPCYETAPCDVNIKSVNVGACYVDAYDQKSRTELTICVEWKNRPNNENIYVSIDGQYQVIYPTSADGYKCVKFNVLANGSYNNGIWAKFQYSTACMDEAVYHTPQPCYAPPPCDIEITDVNVGACYYDHADYKSKAILTVCVKWTNRPTNQNIYVSINGQYQVIQPTASSGTKCVQFTILANGVSGYGIWAKFQYATTCQDEAKYNAPQGCYQAPPCELEIVSTTVGACYYDHATYQSKSKLTVCVKWKNRPVGESIYVSIAGQYKIIYPSASTGTACVEFIVSANGTQNNGIWAKFQHTTACQDEAYYHCPPGCYEAPPCDIDITSATVGACYYDHSSYSSKAELTVCINWKNRPTNENIVVSIAGQQQIIYPTAATGSKCIKFVVPANGTYNNGIWAKFQYSTACQDEAKYHCPVSCVPPPCDLDITSVTTSACYFDHSTYQSLAKVKICVTWKNRPTNENIYVSIAGGQYKVIYPTTTNGTACVEFVVSANGSYNNGIWAKFQYSTACQDEDKFHCPVGCAPPPPCDLNITHVSTSACYYDHYTYQSLVKVKICVDYKNRPTNENIVISISGQQKIVYPTASSGTACVEFVVPANGTYNNGIWAKFQYTTSCQDESYYHCPQPCAPPPCDLEITNVTTSACYYDHYTYQSSAKVKICVTWKNRPTNENIYVSIAGGQYKVIYPTASTGTACVEFVVPANGSYNNGIWAKFQYTTTCQDEAKFHCPQPCAPPPCDLDISDVSTSACYYDHSTYQSLAKVKICVTWKNRPNNENIYVSIAGQQKIVYPTASSGTACVEFVVSANGSYHNGIWAKFQSTTSCQDESYYHCPQPCYEAPPCELKIKSAVVGACYFDTPARKSKAKVTVCFEWKHRPNNEQLLIIVGEETKVYTPQTSSGNDCLEFIVDADGAYHGIWAKFKYTHTCVVESKYYAPLPCSQTSVCDLKITKAVLGDCYYERLNGGSKTKLTVCLEFKNAPANEKIIVKVGTTIKYIYYNVNQGTVCVDFIVPADGKLKNRIWAYFERSVTCQVEKFYDAKFPCISGNASNDDDDDEDGDDLISTSKPTIDNVDVQLSKVAVDGGTPDVRVEDAPAQASFELETTNPTTTARELRVFPNPTRDDLWIDLSSFAGKTVQLQVFNTVGQVVYQTTIDEVNTDKVQLDVRQYASELYFLKVSVPNEGTYTQKFVVKK